jgi:transcriptional regulator with GAF, ATPase, and Fis domain
MKQLMNAALTDVALQVQELSRSLWGGDKTVDMIGLSKPYVELLGKLEKVANFNEPVLITGESGSGKEGIVQAIYLLGPRRGRPMVSVNCPQYQEGNLTVSELFGHRKGSFTGASADRKGCFETADGGVIFLDEIGDLHMSAQVMLLRALANGEFQPLGADTPKRVNVRVVGATNRPLEKLVIGKEFRHDLYFRLRYFLLRVPSLRERGDDWLLLMQHVLSKLHEKYGVEKRLSPAALKLLETYLWPGNVRELISVTTMGYALCDGDVIEPHDFVSYLVPEESEPGLDDSRDELYDRVVLGTEIFWEAVYTPFMERDLNRKDVRNFMKKALLECNGSYRTLLDLLRLPQEDYQRLMDFLRHQRLKP